MYPHTCEEEKCPGIENEFGNNLARPHDAGAAGRVDLGISCAMPEGHIVEKK